MTFPLAPSTPSALALDPQPPDRLGRLVEGHVREGRYPGAQLAVARHGQLALVRTFGDACLEPSRVPASDDTLWLLSSNTKVLTGVHGAIDA
jgi:CubicO group peptidase (beta-lactamase class C family)